MAGGSQAHGPVEMVVKTIPVRVVTSESLPAYAAIDACGAGVARGEERSTP